MKTLVLGIGNWLLADEGVGVHVAHALEGSGCPENATVLDIGTAILDAAPAIEEADKVIIVDAVKADGAPGTVYRMPYGDFMRPQMIASMHGFDFSRVLALTARKAPPEVVVIGVEPERIDWSMHLSPAVKKAMPVLLEAVRREIRGEKIDVLQ